MVAITALFPAGTPLHWRPEAGQFSGPSSAPGTLVAQFDHEETREARSSRASQLAAILTTRPAHLHRHSFG